MSLTFVFLLAPPQEDAIVCKKVAEHAGEGKSKFFSFLAQRNGCEVALVAAAGEAIAAAAAERWVAAAIAAAIVAARQAEAVRRQEEAVEAARRTGEAEAAARRAEAAARRAEAPRMEPQPRDRERRESACSTSTTRRVRRYRLCLGPPWSGGECYNSAPSRAYVTSRRAYRALGIASSVP